MKDLNSKPEIIIEALRIAEIMFYVLKKLYGCTGVTVCMIGNFTRDGNGQLTTDEIYGHLHFHIIPSYPSPVEDFGLVFRDDNYGKPLNLDPNRGYAKQPVDSNIDILIRDKIRKVLIDQ